MSSLAVAEDRSRTTAARDPQAAIVLDARLGRPPSDVLEATIVLEAWDGRPARRAMAAARGLVDPNGRPKPVAGRLERPDDVERRSALLDGLALVLSILSVAAWAGPLSRELGPRALETAIGVALPVAVALQWVLRSRYMSRRYGLGLLGKDALAWCAVMVLLVLPLVLLPPWGPVAALLIPIWVGGTVLTRRGWGHFYALALVAGTVTLDRVHADHAVLGALAGLTMLLCVAAILTRPDAGDDRAGNLSRALLAGLIGGGIGVLLIGDPSLGWGVHGVHPAIALVPSVIGSFWGGYHLWNLYDALPEGLTRVPLERASQAGLRGPALDIFIGALIRLLGTTIVVSALVASLGRWTDGTDAITIFFAFGCAALVSMILSLLESLSLQGRALVATAAALATEFACGYLLHWHVPGGGLALGADVGVLLTLPGVFVLLSRPGRVLATNLWIR